jgi:NADH:ubiquinone oxidoreductase subunit E
LVARCLGVCSLAPAVVVDGRLLGPCVADEVESQLAGLGEAPAELPR